MHEEAKLGKKMNEILIVPLKTLVVVEVGGDDICGFPRCSRSRRRHV